MEKVKLTLLQKQIFDKVSKDPILSRQFYIAINKLLIINRRTRVKDFVDLYFLLKHFTIWDLIYGVQAKFRMELDIVLIASDFRKVEEFDFLPKMLVPLKLSDLKEFFKQKAIELAKRVTE